MRTRARRFGSHARRLGSVAIVALVVIAVGTWVNARPATSPRLSGADRGSSLAPEVVAAALGAQGRTVRREPGVLVERVAVPAAVVAASPDAPDTVWRVTLSGTFPPRAQRYVVLADRRPIAFGVPTANAHAVRAITTDQAVLSARLTAAYGSQPSVPAAPITE